ncbi:4-coumarate--CoA ligase 1-like [Trichoplusia ni]|uniref:4-coumarate--CoA ligase 1-like n=1 Tax=Trichoplusia ni TaxID=7111 RepID=A0A7E5VQL8_TRINI|nr:4-coumarate--CoA ligase 1-like [Trichoplusia ni]
MSSAVRSNVLKVLKKNKNGFLSVAVRQKSLAGSEKNILTSVFKDLPPTTNTVNDFVWQNLERWPDKTATVCAVTGRGYTYAQTHRMSIAFAASLRSKLKLQNDDKVAIILPNIPEYACTILGVLQAGCVASMMNPVYTVDELKRQIQLIKCKAVVASNISYANIKQALSELQMDIPIVLVENEGLPEGTIRFAEFAEDFNLDTDCLKAVRRGPKDLAILPFSSGTTGFPKAVALTHASVLAMNQQIIDPEIVVCKETTATNQAVLPAILPFFHIFGFNSLMLSQMTQGAKMVTLPYFKPELFLKTLVQHKAEVLFLVPPMVVFLGKHPAVTPKHLESVYGIISGAAPISAQDAEAIVAKNKAINFRQGYGLTETNGGISVGRNDDHNHASVGHVFPSSKVKIADLQTQEALGPGQEGEIWYRGPNVMNGYYENEEATKEVMTEDGWYKTGDIGRYDDKKYLYVTDRLKELIKVKGFQVPPAELEMVLRTHPKVLDCAVLGIPDEISGELPKAFVVTQQGQTLKDDEILDYVNSKVAVFKKIKEVQFVKEIPKSAAGKILRKNLKEMYC